MIGLDLCGWPNGVTGFIVFVLQTEVLEKRDRNRHLYLKIVGKEIDGREEPTTRFSIHRKEINNNTHVCQII